MKLHRIETELFKLDGGAMFSTVPKSIWSHKYPSDANNLCALAMRCLLVEEEDRKILIDTGIGDKQNEKFFNHYDLDRTNTLDRSLQKIGYTPEDITDVLLTHFHLDHIGGAVIRENNKLIPKFKNATYWTNERHLQHALNSNEREKHSFLKENICPLQEHGVFKYIKIEQNISFSKHIRIQFFYGHTEAMMLPLINYGDKTLAYVADLIPCAFHIPIGYVASYDIRPLQSFQEKQVFLKEALANNYTLFLEHDAYQECVTLHETEKGIRLKDTFPFETFLTS